MPDSLPLLIRSDNPLIVIDTMDKSRALERVYQAGEELGIPTLQWSLTGGLRRLCKGLLYESLTHVKQDFSISHELDLRLKRKHTVWNHSAGS